MRRHSRVDMKCVNFKGKVFWVRKEWKEFSRSAHENPRHFFWSRCLHVPAILGNTGGIAGFSRPWSDMRERQQHSLTWHLPLPCFCRCPGMAILTAFPLMISPCTRGKQVTGSFPQSCSGHLCYWCSFLCWAGPISTAQSSYARL